MRKFVFIPFILALMLGVVVLGSLAQAEDVSHVFTVTVYGDYFAYEYVGNDPGNFPTGVNMCEKTNEDPWFLCGFYPEPGWVGETLPLSNTVYFVGSGASPITYTLCLTVSQMGWGVAPAGDGLVYEAPPDQPEVFEVYLPLVTKPQIKHEFFLTYVGDNLQYVYTGNSPENFPKFVNYCRGLADPPWYECGFNATPNWNGVVLDLDPQTYFIGTDVGPAYIVAPSAAQIGWSVTSSNDGFFR